MHTFDLAATLRASYPDARLGIDYTLEKPSDEPLRLALWNAIKLGPLPQDILDQYEASKVELKRQLDIEAAFARELPLDDIIEALLETLAKMEVEPKLAAVLKKREEILSTFAKE